MTGGAAPKRHVKPGREQPFQLGIERQQALVALSRGSSRACPQKAHTIGEHRKPLQQPGARRHQRGAADFWPALLRPCRGGLVALAGRFEFGGIRRKLFASSSHMSRRSSSSAVAYHSATCLGAAAAFQPRSPGATTRKSVGGAAGGANASFAPGAGWSAAVRRRRGHFGHHSRRSRLIYQRWHEPVFSGPLAPSLSAGGCGAQTGDTAGDPWRCCLRCQPRLLVTGYRSASRWRKQMGAHRDLRRRATSGPSGRQTRPGAHRLCVNRPGAQLLWRASR